MDEFEQRLRGAYAAWKKSHAADGSAHPGDETFACFIDGMLSAEEEARVRKHILSCPSCSRELRAHLTMSFPAEDPPRESVEKVRHALEQRLVASVMDVVVRWREMSLQLESSSGDVLVGQEFIPAGVYRSRQSPRRQETLTVYKDFQDVRIALRIDVKGAAFSVTVSGKEKETQKAVAGLRISLARDDRELESFHSETGTVGFERVQAGKYTISVSARGKCFAVLFLEIVA